MRGRDIAIIQWLDPDFVMPQTVYIDAGSYKHFLTWLDQDLSKRVTKLTTGTWQIVLFKRQLNRLHVPEPARTRRLREMGIVVDNSQPRASDEMYIAEVQRVYFHNDPNAQVMAEFLALCRRQAGLTSRLAVMSQHYAFRRIPLVDTFFVPDIPLEGSEDLPAQFDFFTDLAIHKHVQSATAEAIADGRYPFSVFEGAKSLFDYLRYCSGLTTDGSNLVEQALKRDGSYIKLNNLSNPTEISEQRGYKDLALGVAGAVRNPTAHVSAKDPYILDRFGDKKAALKVLCLLSLICEGLDRRVI